MTQVAAQPTARVVIQPAVAGMAAGAALAAVAAFLPWAVARVPLLGQITVNGVEGDGRITLAAGLAALAATVWRWRKPAAADRAAAALNFMLGAGIFFVALYHIATLNPDGNDIPVTVGNGLYLTVAAAVVLMAAACADFAHALNRR